jgi:type II secretory pathway pseudopilin PulG
MQQKGQTLVEAIVVIGMVMLMVTGLISGTTAALKSSQSVKTRSEATKYAEDGIETLRLMRDTNWSSIASYVDTGSNCFNNDGKFSGVCTPTSDTNLTRKVTLNSAGANTIHVNVTVTYSEGGVLKAIPIDTYLTQWR